MYLNQFGSDVLELVLEVNRFGNCHTVLGDLGAAPALLDDDVTTLRQK